MPETGLFKSAIPPEDRNFRGNYKHALEHPQNPDTKLILKIRGESWDEMIPMRPELSLQQKRSFFLANFYSRRLAHVLFPTIFPNCIAANQDTLVVEKINGRQLEDDREISDEERQRFHQAIQALGLSVQNVDTLNPGNFIRDAQGLHYVDDLFFPVNNYFEMLMIMQRPPSEFSENPLINRSWVKTMLEKLQHPRGLSISPNGNFEIFDITVLKGTMARLDPQTQRKATRYLNRLTKHEAAFPGISLPRLKMKLYLFLWKTK